VRLVPPTYSPRMQRIDRHRARLTLLVGIASLTLATIGVGLVRTYLGAPNASIVYLAAVVVTALVGGTPGAILSAIAAFLLYDFFFTEPYHTLTIREPSEWLGVALLLFVGIVVGQLTALQRARAEDARAREREAVGMATVSRELSTRDSVLEVLPRIARILREETRMDRVWVTLTGDEVTERIAGDSADDAPRPVPAIHEVLQRMPGDQPPRWVRVHQPGPKGRRTAGREASAGAPYRIRMTAGSNDLGSIWALQRPGASGPGPAETRFLAAAADQIAQALAHDRLAAEAQAAEIARQSDALKSALLQSVSHDLRTPLATIRAAAGTLRPDSGLSVDERRESAEAIDREVAYLDRLVTNLLDLSRIEAGALRPELDVFELDDLVGRDVERSRARLDARPLDLDLAAPPVLVDPVFLSEAVANVLDNAIKYTLPGTAIRVCANQLPDEPFVRLTIEDAGSGVPAEALGRLFEKFYRVPGQGRGSRSGTGIGLAVVRGLIEASGGRVVARRSELGGLAIDLIVPAAAVPAEVLAGTIT
jgi:two-component system sensor histidine kinase KdpD